MVDPATVGMVVSGVVEVSKLIAQAYFASTRQAGLTDEQAMELLESERERFKRNIAEPLPDV